MAAMKNLAVDIQMDIEAGELSFEEIALKHDVSLREVDHLAFDLMDQYNVESHHDELERDWDERYENDECYPDPDAEYESRYELNDF